MIRKLILSVALATTVLSQAQSAKPPAHRPVAAPSPIDTVINLVKGGMSEAMVIKTLQREGKAIPVSPTDALRLQKAGVSEKIMDVMTDPGASVQAQAQAAPALDMPPGGGAPTPAPAPPPPPVAAAEPTLVTPFPADIPTPPSTRKRRVAVEAFGDGAVKNWTQAIFQNNADVGAGIRSMLAERLQQSSALTVLERANIDSITKEQALGNSQQSAHVTRPRKGRILGADCMVAGDILIFGRDDKTRKQGVGLLGLVPKYGAILGGLSLLHKDEKAVVEISYRIVDAETSEFIASGKARGESSRKSKELLAGGGGIGSGGAGGAVLGTGMNSTNFQQTILGEATLAAVDIIAKDIEGKVPQFAPKKREIEGRVATIVPNSAYLALGANDGVQVGDRFAILQINNEILDPETKDVIDVEAEKVGELVITEVRDKTAIGNYGGQPLSPAQLSGKGYQARLTVR